MLVPRFLIVDMGKECCGAWGSRADRKKARCCQMSGTRPSCDQTGIPNKMSNMCVSRSVTYSVVLMDTCAVVPLQNVKVHTLQE